MDSADDLSAFRVVCAFKHDRQSAQCRSQICRAHSEPRNPIFFQAPVWELSNRNYFGHILRILRGWREVVARQQTDNDKLRRPKPTCAGDNSGTDRIQSVNIHSKEGLKQEGFRQVDMPQNIPLAVLF